MPLRLPLSLPRLALSHRTTCVLLVWTNQTPRQPTIATAQRNQCDPVEAFGSWEGTPPEAGLFTVFWIDQSRHSRKTASQFLESRITANHQYAAAPDFASQNFVDQLGPWPTNQHSKQHLLPSCLVTLALWPFTTTQIILEHTRQQSQLTNIRLTTAKPISLGNMFSKFAITALVAATAASGMLIVLPHPHCGRK